MQQQTIDVMVGEYAAWEIVTSIYIWQSRSDWVLLKRKKKSEDWQNYRLCVLGTQKKRSFWLGWNPTEQRFADGGDSYRLYKELLGLKQRLEEYLSKSTEPLQDTAAKEDRVSNAMEALERLRTSNIFDRARESTSFTRPPD